jgi:uncharacterized protein
MAKPETDIVTAVREGYAFEGPCVELGALIADGEPRPDAKVRVPLAMLNRHGLVAGATGTDKTKTLQLMAEQLSVAGVPVFAADIKGDLSGLASPGEPNERVDQRANASGQQWRPTAYPVELLRLGDAGMGVPVRATVSSFGPTLLSKVLELNDTQESSLGLVFHYADHAGLPLLDLKDLRAVIQHLTSDEGEADLEGLGGLAKATAGVILRSLINFAESGADTFFGEPEFDVEHVMRVAPDGRGMITLFELPGVQDRPVLFSTFLMWLLAELFEVLPEAGDLDEPKLVFFFDEAHLMFKDASRAFTNALVQTVRPISVQGSRCLLRHPDSEGRPRGRAGPTRQPDPAPAAGVHPQRRRRTQGDSTDVPDLGLRPGGAAHRPRPPCLPIQHQACTPCGVCIRLVVRHWSMPLAAKKRRMRDSNPRGVAPNTLSKRAP